VTSTDEGHGLHAAGVLAATQWGGTFDLLTASDPAESGNVVRIHKTRQTDVRGLERLALPGAVGTLFHATLDARPVVNTDTTFGNRVSDDHPGILVDSRR
jgi:hypothetical protein